MESSVKGSVSEKPKHEAHRSKSGGAKEIAEHSKESEEKHQVSGKHSHIAGEQAQISRSKTEPFNSKGHELTQRKPPIPHFHKDGRKKTLSKAEADDASTRIQSHWRKAQANRHVGLIRLIYANARNTHMARPEYQQREAGTHKLEPTADCGKGWQVVQKEVFKDVLWAVKKCMFAQKGLTFMVRDPIKVERVKKIKQRLRAVRTVGMLSGGASFWRSLQDVVHDGDSDEDEGEHPTFLIGDPVTVRKAFFSINPGTVSPEKLHKGLNGKVVSFDCEGNMWIQFEDVEEQQLVKPQNFSKLVSTDALDAELYAADKAARKIQLIFHRKKLRKLQKQRTLFKIRMMRNLTASGLSHACTAKSEDEKDDSDFSRAGSCPVGNGANRRSADGHDELQARMAAIQKRLEDLQNLETRERELEAKRNFSANAATQRALQHVFGAALEGSAKEAEPQTNRDNTRETFVQQDDDQTQDTPSMDHVNVQFEPPAIEESRESNLGIDGKQGWKMPSRPQGKHSLQAKAKSWEARRTATFRKPKRWLEINLQLACLRKNPDAWEAAGLQVGTVDSGRELVILNIEPGPAQRWNDDVSHHFGLKKFRVGDRIMRVGSATACDDMARELFQPSSSVMTIEVRASVLKEAETFVATASPIPSPSMKVQEDDHQLQSVLPSFIGGGFTEFAFAAAVALSQVQNSTEPAVSGDGIASASRSIASHPGASPSFDDPSVLAPAVTRPQTLERRSSKDSMNLMAISEDPKEFATVTCEHMEATEDAVLCAIIDALVFDDEEVVRMMQFHGDLFTLSGQRAEHWIHNLSPYGKGQSIISKFNEATDPDEEKYYTALLLFKYHMEMSYQNTNQLATDTLQACGVRAHQDQAHGQEQQSTMSALRSRRDVFQLTELQISSSRPNQSRTTYMTAPDVATQSAHKAQHHLTLGGSRGSSAVAAVSDADVHERLLFAEDRAKALQAPLPRWLSPHLFGPQLQAVICDLSASEGFNLLTGLELERSTGAECQQLYKKLHRACTNAAGKGIWVALVLGASCDAAGQHNLVEWQLWREALWHIGMASLRQKHRRISTLLSDWCMQTINAEWGKQLVGLEEAIGWCSRNLDLLSARRSPSLRLTNTEDAEKLLRAGYLVAATEASKRKCIKRLILPSAVREEVRSLEAERWKSSYRENTKKFSDHKCDVVVDYGALDTNSVISSCVSEGSCIAFSEFRNVLDRAVNTGSTFLGKRSSTAKMGAARSSARGSRTPRWRELRVS